MQILGNEKAFKDKNLNVPTIYEKERDLHMSDAKSKVDSLNEAKKVLFRNYKEVAQTDSSVLTSPKTKRDEIYNIKKRLIEYNQFK